MKHVFIVNPVSGKADASLYLVPRLIDAAAGAGVDYAVELTQHAGHAAEIARQYGDDGEPPLRLRRGRYFERGIYGGVSL